MESEQSGIQSHRDLVVWQKAMDLVDMTYAIARRLPADEIYGLRSQMTRAAVSVAANIAEGATRTTSKDFANFISNAKSSLMELETELMVVVRQNFVSESQASPSFALITEVSKTLTALRKRVLAKGRR